MVFLRGPKKGCFFMIFEGSKGCFFSVFSYFYFFIFSSIYIFFIFYFLFFIFLFFIFYFLFFIVCLYNFIFYFIFYFLFLLLSDGCGVVNIFSCVMKIFFCVVTWCGVGCVVSVMNVFYWSGFVI